MILFIWEKNIWKQLKFGKEISKIVRTIVVIFFEVFCDYTHPLYILEYEYDTHLP